MIQNALRSAVSRWVVLGAFLAIAMFGAKPAQAQTTYKISDGQDEAKAVLSQDRRTLTITGPAGTFQYTYESQLNTEGELGYSGDHPIREIRWPRTGKGPIYAVVNDRWTKIGDVTPAQAASPFPVRFWQANIGAVLSLDIRLDGRYLASGGANGAVRIWDLNTYRNVNTWTIPGASVAYRRGGHLATGGPRPNGTGAANIDRLNRVVPVAGAPMRIDSVAYRWDGAFLAVGGMHRHPKTQQYAGCVQLYFDDGTNLHPGTMLWHASGAAVRAMAFGPNNRFLITASGGNENQGLGQVTNWTLADGTAKQLPQFQGVAYSVSAGVTGANREVVVAVGGVRTEGGRKQGFVTLIRANGSKTEACPEPVYAVALSRDATQLALGSGNSVQLFIDGKNENTRLPCNGVVRSVVFSPDGSRLAAGDANGVITVWQLGRPGGSPAILPMYRQQIVAVDAQTNQPIDNARITLRNGPDECLPVPWKGPRATRLFESRATGRYNFVAQADGYPDTPFSADFGAKELLWTVKLARAAPPKTTPKAPDPKVPAASVLLKVLGSDGSAIQDPTIQFLAGPGKETFGGAADGGVVRYTVTQAGEYRVMVSKEGYTSQTFAVRADGRPQTVTLQRVLTLLLTILDGDNRAVDEPDIRITGPGRSERRPVSGGVHAFSLTAGGTYTVTISKKGLEERVEKIEIRDAETRRTIRMSSGFGLRLTVVDAAGGAVDSPTIDIRGPGAFRSQGSDGGVHRYAFTSNGRYAITISKPGYKERELTLDIQPGSAEETVRLERLDFQLQVEVRDEGDRPVVKLAVDAGSGDAAETTPGRYALRLVPGSYRVRFSRDGEIAGEQVVKIDASDVALRLGPDGLELARRYHREMDKNGNGDGVVDASDFTDGWAELSRLIDHDRDGKLELEEIAAHLKQVGLDDPKPAASLPAPRRAEAVRNQLGVLPGGRTPWAKKDMAAETWEFLENLDANKDGVIDVAEQGRFADAVQKKFLTKIADDPDATTVPAALISLRKRFRRLDRNGDGVGRNDVTADAWLWVLRHYDENGNDRLEATEELAFLTDFQSAATEFLAGSGSLDAVLRTLFRKRDRDGRGVDAGDVGAAGWNQVLVKYDTDPKNGRIDRNEEENRFLKDFQAKLTELLKLMIEGPGAPAALPPRGTAAQLRANLGKLDSKKDGIGKDDVGTAAWDAMLKPYDRNGNDRLDPPEEDAFIEAVGKQVDEPAGDDAEKRGVLTIRKVASD